MENLEEQIINRLNKILNKYNLAIVSKNNHNYKTTTHVDNTFKKYCTGYKLVEIENNTIIECYRSWDNIEVMLLGSVDIYSIFNSINIAHENVKLYNNFNDYAAVAYRRYYILLNKLYNELHSLNNCSCLEEFNIRMDLLGI
jgi:hypothetical protein